MMYSDEPNSPESQLQLQLTHRRGVLGTLGLAGLGVLASSTSASAFTFQKKNETPTVTVSTSSSASLSRLDLPGEWEDKYGAHASEYYRYLSSLNLQRVCPKQVIENHARAKGPVWNSLPPKQWWKRMGYTLRVVDRIAKEMNVSKVEIVSAYRNPAYNARCPGAKSGSFHQANVATDVKFPMRPSKVAAAARELRNLGLFKGGVGGYWNFTHIDCRGKNVDW
jgi:hypothetical protein